IISSELTSRFSINFETTNDITVELVTSKTSRTTELLVKIEPDNNQNFQLSESQLDYKNSFLEDQLDRLQISIIALIKDINLNDIVEQSFILATDIIILDLHIIKQIRDANIHNTKGQQIANKKVRYTNRFRKMKKALNTALDLSCKKKLIDIITHFVEQKKFEFENINIESTHSSQSEEVVIIDFLVIKHQK
ncbi:8663_t:CDS:2, partial [Scutellospora calospora]